MTTEENTPTKTIVDDSTTLHKFDADITQLMSLIINSVYSDKEIFIRELISNSSDALDKIRYLSITDQNLVSEQSELHIKIQTDEDRNVIIIEDTGIGMSKEELIFNLGTIARSGTKQFIKTLSAQDDYSLIGQFGIGFYSVFLVCDKVEVRSKQANSSEHVWTSNSGSGFTITDISDEDKLLKRGTRITIHLKEDQKEYLDEFRIKAVVEKHSQFVSYPISLLCKKQEQSEIPIEDGEEVDEGEQKDNDELIIEDVTEEEKVKTKTVTEVRMEWDVLNATKPLWIKNKTEITDEEYNNFYKTTTRDWDDCASHNHFCIEGNTSFKSILYIPRHKGMELYGPKTAASKIKLYVRRVFVLEQCQELMPEYLHFVSGVVDSDDLSLNISREILQKSSTLQKIRKILVKKVIKMMIELSKDDDKWDKFYSEFHKNIKWGINDDAANSKQLIELLQWHESLGTEKPTSLKKYVENMKDDQKHIYYITAENEDQALRSPFLEKLNKKGYSCLLLCDAIDEYVTQSLTEYDGKKLINVTKGNLDIELSEKEKKFEEKQKETYDDLCKKVKDVLAGKVEKVIISQKVVDSPCIISTGEQGWSANMARIMKAQALRDTQVNNFYKSKKIFELNPESKTVKLLKEKADKLNDTNQTEFTNIVNLLFDTCQIVSGFNIQEPEQYSKKVYNLINLGLGDGDSDDDDDKDDDKDDGKDDDKDDDKDDGKDDEVDLEKEVEEIILDEQDNLEMEGVD